MNTALNYTNCNIVQLKKLLSTRKIKGRSSLTTKDDIVNVLKKYDEKPNDETGLKKYVKMILEKNIQTKTTQVVSLSEFKPSQESFSIFGNDDTQSMMSEISTFSDLSILPDVVPSEVQYPDGQDVVHLKMTKFEFETMEKMLDHYQKMMYKTQTYSQNRKNKLIELQNQKFIQEGKVDKRKPFIESKPFVKQITLNKFLVK